MKRVVVTGIGAVTCLGNSLSETWQGLTAGRSGIGTITLFDPAGLPNIAGEVRDLKLNVSPKEERRLARYERFAVSAADEAMAQAGLAGGRDGDPYRFGTLISCTTGGLDVYEKGLEVLARRGAGGVSAFFVPKFMSNGASGTLAGRYGLKGPNFNPVSACASSLHALGEAMWMIRRGDADLMLAGGAESCLTKVMMSGFHSLTALSCGPDPVRACRPFDLNRDGFVMGEGAAVMVLEELEHAVRRGAVILAELAGYGASCDAYHITAPDPTGAGMSFAMRRALDCAECPPDEISCIYAHGTGTKANDRCESNAVHDVFGSRTGQIKISAVKSMIGHAISAAGAQAAAAAVQTLQTNLVPPVLNYETPDPECMLNITSCGCAEIDAQAAMISSLGFGGHNAVLIFRRWKG